MRTTRIGGMLGILVIAASAGAGARERLVEAAAESRALHQKAEAWDDEKNYVIEAAGPEDREASIGKRFARASEVAGYEKVRPWSAAYADRPGRGQIGWPTDAEAGALRELLKDRDASVRSLAVEALGVTGRPEDVAPIAGLLEDRALGAVVLGWSRQHSSQPYVTDDRNPIVPERTWHERTVGTYARQALKLMTGHRFDGEDPQGVTFAQWWKTHDLGRASLWYWEQRLRRERGIPEGRRAAAHRATVEDLARMPADVQWKVFLLATESPGDGEEAVGPVNPLWPEGTEAELSAGRLKELIAGETRWPDAADVGNGRALMLARLARMIDRVTRGYGAPMVYKQSLAAAMERQPKAPWMQVLVSRLLPEDAGAAYLKKSMAETEEGYARESIAGELVRGHLAREWTYLEKLFRDEREQPDQIGSSARTGILKALGEEPHTAERARRLAELLEDPRNEEVFTRENRVMGMDMCRYWAMRAVNAIAGREVVTNEVEQGLKQPARAPWALGELRRLAREAASAAGS